MYRKFVRGFSLIAKPLCVLTENYIQMEYLLKKARRVSVL